MPKKSLDFFVLSESWGTETGKQPKYKISENVNLTLTALVQT